MNRFEMFVAMVERKVVTLNGTKGLIQAIQLEDGSGKCFNVSLYCADGQIHKVFIRN